MESVFGMLNIVVGRLKQRGKPEAEQNGNDTVVINKVGQLSRQSELFGISEQHKKRKQNSDGNHNAVHMHVQK